MRELIVKAVDEAVMALVEAREEAIDNLREENYVLEVVAYGKN